MKAFLLILMILLTITFASAIRVPTTLEYIKLRGFAIPDKQSIWDNYAEQAKTRCILDLYLFNGTYYKTILGVKGALSNGSYICFVPGGHSNKQISSSGGTEHNEPVCYDKTVCHNECHTECFYHRCRNDCIEICKEVCETVNSCS